MAIQSKVSLPVIKRLPKYYRYLTNLSVDGKEKISSSELAHMMGTTASQVRQDFNCFGGFGQKCRLRWICCSSTENIFIVCRV